MKFKERRAGPGMWIKRSDGLEDLRCSTTAVHKLKLFSQPDVQPAYVFTQCYPSHIVHLMFVTVRALQCERVLDHARTHTHTNSHERLLAPFIVVWGTCWWCSCFSFALADNPFKDIDGTRPSSRTQVLLVRCHCGCRWPVYVFSSKLDLSVKFFRWHDDTSHNHWISIKYKKETFLKGVGLPTFFCKRLLHVFLQFFNPRPHHASFESLQLQTSFPLPPWML